MWTTFENLEGISRWMCIPVSQHTEKCYCLLLFVYYCQSPVFCWAPASHICCIRYISAPPPQSSRVCPTFFGQRNRIPSSSKAHIFNPVSKRKDGAVQERAKEKKVDEPEWASGMRRELYPRSPLPPPCGPKRSFLSRKTVHLIFTLLQDITLGLRSKAVRLT